MTLRKLALLCLSILIARIASAEIPTHLQTKILEKAPQADINSDGMVTIGELEKVYPSLPDKVQQALRRKFPDLGKGQPAQTNTNKKSESSFTFSRPAGDPAVGREKGYNCLFMGHSFFFPIVKHIESHAQNLGLDHHQQFIASSGGATGSPGQLWTSKKDSVATARELLRSGRVELLALTAHHEGSTVEDYRRWVDLAVMHNPNTIIVIQVPWNIKKNTPFPEYAASAKKISTMIHDRIDALRAAYPDTTFPCIPQGQWMVELWRLYDDKKLPELTEFVGKGKGKSQNALFRDHFGHGGPLAEKEGALLWLNVLYGINLNSYEYETGTQYDLKALAQKICESDPYCSKLD